VLKEDLTMLIITVGFLVASVTLIWAYFRIRMHRMMALAKKIPGPKQLPFLGYVLDIGCNTKGT
jgi:hypothetical protein